MPFVPDFTAVQLSTLSSVVITDTSTGSDVGITSRRIYFQKYNGSYLVPTGTTTEYVLFPTSSGSSIQIDSLLDKSYALNVTVKWLDSGDGVLYEKTIVQGFSGNLKYGLYQLTQYQVPSATSLLQQRNYLNSKLAVWDAVLSGDNAVVYGSDIANAQRCYDKGTAIISNPANFY